MTNERMFSSVDIETILNRIDEENRERMRANVEQPIIPGFSVVQFRAYQAGYEAALRRTKNTTNKIRAELEIRQIIDRISD